MSRNNTTKISLSAWMEIIGKLCSLSIDDQYICLEIDEKTLSYRKNTKEASYIQEMLNESCVGRTIAVLKTDILEKQLRIRLVDRSN